MFSEIEKSQSGDNIQRLGATLMHIRFNLSIIRGMSQSHRTNWKENEDTFLYRFTDEILTCPTMSWRQKDGGRRGTESGEIECFKFFAFHLMFAGSHSRALIEILSRVVRFASRQLKRN